MEERKPNQMRSFHAHDRAKYSSQRHTIDIARASCRRHPFSYQRTLISRFLIFVIALQTCSFTTPQPLLAQEKKRGQMGPATGSETKLERRVVEGGKCGPYLLATDLLTLHKSKQDVRRSSVARLGLERVQDVQCSERAQDNLCTTLRRQLG